MPSRRTVITVSLLVVYSLAVTAGAVFHTHRIVRGDRPGCDCACHHAHGAHHDGSGEPSGNRIPSDRGSSDSCPVCQFLAQKPAPAERVEEVTSAPLVEPVDSPSPKRYASGAPPIHRCRAPPCSV